MATISERIKEALEIRQLKQADLVEKTKIGKSSISTYISGAYEPKQKNIYLLAKALDVNEAWLMGYDVPMERKASPNSEQAFMAYLNSLGYRIYRDDPEHKPFMSTDELTCRLKYNTLDTLKLRIDSYAKAIVDSELLSLKEDEIKQQRLEKERLLQSLQDKNNKLPESEIEDSANQTSCTITPISYFNDVNKAKDFLKSRKLLAAWEIDKLTDADIISMANVIWTEGK